MAASTSMIQTWLASEGAATAIEYALMAAAIALAIIPVVTQLGLNIEAVLFGPVAGAF